MDAHVNSVGARSNFLKFLEDEQTTSSLLGLARASLGQHSKHTMAPRSRSSLISQLADFSNVAPEGELVLITSKPAQPMILTSTSLAA